MKKISIIIPAYNEEESLPFLYDKLNELMDHMKQYEFEILFVNDGSKDKTIELIKEYREKDPRYCYVDFARNFGKEIAMIAGLDYATGDCAIFMDADLQDPPELIPELVKYWEEGYDDVYARRRSRDGETFLKKFTSKMYYRVLQKMTKIEIQKDTGDFRLLDRRCINALKKLRESQRNTKSMFSWIGYKKKEVLYDRDARVAGKTKWNYMKLIDLAIDGITSFTTSGNVVSYSDFYDVIYIFNICSCQVYYNTYFYTSFSSNNFINIILFWSTNLIIWYCRGIFR